MIKKRIWILTMFEEYFTPFRECGVLGSALRGERSVDVEFEIQTVLIRKFSPKDYKGVDDSPFGGGVGMIMRADVLKSALFEGVIKAGHYDEKNWREKLHIVCPMPRGKTWDQNYAQDFAHRVLSEKIEKDVVFICGRYEGIDERFLNAYVDEFISLGNFILTGGELATMVILDSSMRFVTGVLGNKSSACDESFFNDLLEYPLYTRPREFEGMEIPEALISGDHKKIAKFKDEERKKMTQKYRPDLWEKYEKKS
jgi:tRNA (guanine37-N1)-methyltransferase